MILIKDRHLNPLNLVLQIEHDTYKGSTQINLISKWVIEDMGNMILIKYDTYKGSTLEYVPANGVISDREI